VPETLVLPLRNNLLLTITGQPTLRALAGFLSAAIIHFKNQQDIQQIPLYTAGSFQGRVGTNDCAISHPGDITGDYLAPAAWLEALRDVHGLIDALEEIRANIPLLKAQNSGESRIKAGHRAARAAVPGKSPRDPGHPPAWTRRTEQPVPDHDSLTRKDANGRSSCLLLQPESLRTSSGLDIVQCRLSASRPPGAVSPHYGVREE